MNSSSPSLPWEMILIEQVTDTFFASSEFLLPAAFLSTQLCEEHNICLGLKAFHSFFFPAFWTDLILSSSAQLVFCFCKACVNTCWSRINGINALKQLERKFVGMIHLISGSVQQRSSHVKYYLGSYIFPRTAKRCQAGLLLGRADHLRRYLTAGVIFPSV